MPFQYILYLHSFSDRSLYSGALFILILAASGWYFFIYRNVSQKLTARTQQNVRLHKKLESLSKRIRRLDSDYYSSQKILEDGAHHTKNFHESLHDVLQALLSAVKKTGLTMLSWNTQEIEQKNMYATCCLVCSFFGSYQQCTDFLAALENFSCVTHCVLKRRVTDLHIHLTLRLFFRKK